MSDRDESVDTADPDRVPATPPDERPLPEPKDLPNTQPRTEDTATKPNKHPEKSRRSAS